ncbi:MAG: DUF1566 domain-containing protein [Betaproteobacteria bacterium]|nr:DUF1566 domain-containing protein [Betaproteobacteria bacterium]
MQSACGNLLSAFLFVFPAMPLSGVAQTALPLNDTGMTQCSDGAGWVDCASVSADSGNYPRQDGRFGRDNAIAARATAKTGAGAAGFDYTKICNNGAQEGEAGCKAASRNLPGRNPDDWGCNRDNLTGLLWRVEPEEQTDWFRATDAGYPPVIIARAIRLCGSDAWRLPERRELISLVHNGRNQAPYIDTTYFPGTPRDGLPALFWANREFSENWAWYVYFGFGGSGFRDKADAASVRLVSGSRTKAPLSANGDGTVLDSATGLLWDRCTFGQTGSDCDGTPLAASWQEALAASVEANRSRYKGHNDWRLPNKNELESLIDLSRKGMFIDTQFFPKTPDTYFWSSTPTTAHDAPGAWITLFSIGSIGIDDPNARNTLRLVRGGSNDASFDRLDPGRVTLEVSEIANDRATSNIEVDRNATGYFLVLPASIPMPAAGQIAASGQPHVFAANVPQRFRLDGLFPGSDYRLWFVTQSGANFGAISEARFTTLGGDGGMPVCPVVEGGTLGADCLNRVSPGAKPAFCLPSSGTVALDIEGVRYTLAAHAGNTCLEIVSVDGSPGAPLLRQGAASIEAVYPESVLLAARNGDTVRADLGGSRISARMDSACTSTRISLEAGQTSAPAWMTNPHPGGACPPDALTPPGAHYAINDGVLACPATMFSIRGTYRSLSLSGTLNLEAGQQIFVAARIPATEAQAEMWFQATRDRGWLPFGPSFDSFAAAEVSGARQWPLLSQIDVRALPANTELYLGYGKDAEEMMAKRRYCGFFTLGTL